MRVNGHVVDRGPRFGAERVPRNTARERRKSVVVRDAHDDPLDDIGVSQDADIHERSAPRVGALERELGVSATPADNREQRDVVATDPDNDRVVDERGIPFPTSSPKRRLTASMHSGARQNVSSALTVSKDCLTPMVPPETTKSDSASRQAIASARRCWSVVSVILFCG